MEDLREFWNLVLDVWHNGVMGVDIGRMLSAIGVIVLFMVLRSLLTRFVMGWLRALTKRTRWEFDDKVLETLEPPVRFIPVVLGLFFAVQILEPTGAAAEIAENLIRSLIAFIIFWGFFRMIEPAGELLHKLDRIFTPELIEWLVRAIKVVVFVVGAAAVLEIWGIQVGPIIAGFGLLGVAVALGAQDLFKNLIAGLLILGEKRFKKGDWIRVSGVVEGTVEAIGFRSTMVRRFDKAPVMVPNAQLSDSAVTNFSQMSHRRIRWVIGVEYNTSVDQLRRIRDEIEDYILGSDEFAPRTEVSTFVRIDSFNDSSIDILLYCFTKTTKWGVWLEIKERLAYRVKEIVEGAGSGFAFPSQSLYVESLPSGAASETDAGTGLETDAPERFVPPTSSASAAKKSPVPVRSTAKNPNMGPEMGEDGE